MLLDCNIVEKTAKAGNVYRVLRIKLSDNPPVSKDCFITDAEIGILSMSQNSSN